MATPPDETICVPALTSVAPTALPPRPISWTPAFDTVAPLVTPPEETNSMPLLLTAAPLSRPPLKTVSVPPLLSHILPWQKLPGVYKATDGCFRRSGDSLSPAECTEPT